MKHYQTLIRSTASILLSVIFSVSVFGAEARDLSPSQGNLQTFTKDMLQAQSFEPGFAQLSLKDEYASYQWGLKNDGQLQLVRMIATFRSLDSIYGKRKGRSSSITLPDLGPGLLEIEPQINHAVSGMDINILPAWEQYDAKAPEEKRQVIVAVIDTGIDYSHPELQNAMWTNPGEIPGDGIDNDQNGYIDDVHGWNFHTNSPTLYSGTEDSHGTHTAGTIAAARGTGGIAGITDNQYVKLMSLKALGGPLGIGSPDAVIQAIHYAEINGASICNLSLGSSSYSRELADAIANSNMLFIIACGNGDSRGKGYDTDLDPVYPAALPLDNVISVASLHFDGNLAASSNFGARTVDLAAPGSYILSTAPGGGYAIMSGTSMAAPMVTGVSAMVYSYRTDLTLAGLKQAIIGSARPTENLQGKVASGGILDAFAALNYGITSDEQP